MRLNVLVWGLGMLAGAMLAGRANAGDPKVVLETSEGDITLKLNAEKSPKTVANFLEYVKSGHYNGTIFHRVIPKFMIQGGGFTEDMKEKSTRAPIKNEARNGLKNSPYTIAMARTRHPHSASAQFFINTVNNHGLNADEAGDGWGYAVFGEVVDGKDVVDAIAKVKTGRKGRYENVPLEPITIKKAKVVEEK